MPSTERLEMALYCTACLPGYHLPCFAGETSDIFRRHGLSIEIVDPEPGPANIAAVASGSRIDALPFHEAGIDIYGSGLVASTRLLRDRPQTARRAIAAFGEAPVASREEPALGLEALLDHIPAADPQHVLAGWDAGAPLIFDAEATALGTMSAQRWRRAIQYHADAYGGPREIAVEEVFDGSAPADAAAAHRENSGSVRTTWSAGPNAAAMCGDHEVWAHRVGA